MDATSTTIPSNLTSAEVEGIIGQRLKNYVKGCTSLFTCGGSLALPSPPAVTIVGEDGGAGESIAIQVPSELRPGTTLRPRDYEKQPSYIVNVSGGNPYEESEKVRVASFAAETCAPLILTDHCFTFAHPPLFRSGPSCSISRPPIYQT